MGNQEFPENARIQSTPAANRGMQEEIADLKDPGSLEIAYREAITSNENLLASTTDPGRMAVLQSAIRRNQCALEELPRLSPRLPDITFGANLKMAGDKRSVTLMPVPPAHTSGDCMMEIEGEPILFLGDIGFFKTHPFMIGCDPIGWIHQLEGLEKSSYKTFVPGHGPLGTREDLKDMQAYIQILGRRVVEALMNDKDIRSVQDQHLPDVCLDWEPTLSRYQKNVQYLFEYHRQNLAGEKID